MKKTAAFLLVLTMLAALFCPVCAEEDIIGSYGLVLCRAGGVNVAYDLMPITIELGEDGRAVMSLDGENTEVRWERQSSILTITEPDGEVTTGTVKNGVMTLTGKGMTMFLISDRADEYTRDVLAAAADWNKDFYGWWYVYEGEGSYADLTGSFWDLCIEMRMGADGVVDMLLWDEDASRSMPTGEFLFRLEKIDGNYVAVSRYGYFLGQTFGYGDVVLEPGLTPYENLMCLLGLRVENGEDAIVADLFFKPWFSTWEDCAENPEGVEWLPGDMLPKAYSDWYLPEIEQMHTMPDEIGGSGSTLGIIDETVTEPGSGEVLRGSGLDGMGTLTIDNSRSITNALVKLKDEEGIDVFIGYVKAGDEVSFDVPAGVFRTYFAYGGNWQGPELCFGKKTRFTSDPDFNDYAEYSWSYTTYATEGGDFIPDTIEAEDF